MLHALQLLTDVREAGWPLLRLVRHASVGQALVSRRSGGGKDELLAVDLDVDDFVVGLASPREAAAVHLYEVTVQHMA